MGLSAYIEKMIIARQLDFHEGRFELLGIRAAILPTFTLTRFIEAIYDGDEDDLVDALFDIGRKHGRYAIDAIGRKHGMGKQEFLDKTIGSANVLGVGKLQVAEYSPKKGVLRFTIHDSPFTETFATSDVLADIDGPIDHLQRGMVHGVAQELFDGPVTSQEVQCAFQGDDHCEIVVQRVDTDEQHDSGDTGERDTT